MLTNPFRILLFAILMRSIFPLFPVGFMLFRVGMFPMGVNLVIVLPLPFSRLQSLSALYLEK